MNVVLIMGNTFWNSFMFILNASNGIPKKYVIKKNNITV